MSILISETIKDSIAEEIGLKKGDEILTINGQKPLDLIDYNFLCKTEFLTIETKDEIFEIEKDFDEDIGIVFESAVFDRVKPCTNRCIFCFVDQQPTGLRPSLYVKDDDYRLSYLQGTYITLTNLTKKDRKRIDELHLGPLFISVHTTNGPLRAKMLQNPKADKILEDLEWLNSNHIPFHAQIVLCPGYNDGDQLRNTLNDLKKFKKVLLSIAIVPVGVTKYRKTPLMPVTKEIAIETINIIDEFNRSIKSALAAASDEFFVMADIPVPKRNYYGNFSQIEDGVGALRLILDDFEKQKRRLPKGLNKKQTIHIVTSQTAMYAFEQIAKALGEVEGLDARIVVMKSNFWGPEINVAGLTTGQDIIGILSAQKDDVTRLIIPSVMLKPFSTEFLDGITTEEIEKTLDCTVVVIEDHYSTKELVEFVLSLQ